MTLSPIADLVNDIVQGKMIILMDDENRENEGDVIIAAECVNAEHINFMARYARGLICLPLNKIRCEQLGLVLMSKENKSSFSTKFTISIEASKGISTGISASDRAHTIRAAIANGAVPSDIVHPGHIFPLISEDGGVLIRAGHTEAACDLAKLAGFEPAGVICEIMNEDGSMARRSDLEFFSKKHAINIGTIKELIKYRIMYERNVYPVSTEKVETAFGIFSLHTFKDKILGVHHIALVKGLINPYSITTVRVHIQEPLRDLLTIRKNKKYNWIGLQAMNKIVEADCGIMILIDNKKIDFNEQLINNQNSYDNSINYLTIGTSAHILNSLGVLRIRLLNSPDSFSAFYDFGLEIIDYLDCDI